MTERAIRCRARREAARRNERDERVGPTASDEPDNTFNAPAVNTVPGAGEKSPRHRRRQQTHDVPELVLPQQAHDRARADGPGI